MSEPRLSVRHLSAVWHTDRGWRPALDQVSFDIPAGQTVALIGESGCGKSAAARSLLGLLSPPGRVTSGEVRFRGRNLLQLRERELRRVRGAEIAMTCQEPMSALNPVVAVGPQLVALLRSHRIARGRRARARALELLDLVGIPSPTMQFEAFPHQLSSGARRRVAVAMALAGEPTVLIADDPTASLDANVRAHILELFARLQQETQLSLLLITHDLAAAAQLAHEVVVMHAGQVVETTTTGRFLSAPSHPYTRQLLACVPSREPFDQQRPHRLPTLRIPPPEFDAAVGCRFVTRCRKRESLADAAAICSTDAPALRRLQDNHTARCHFAEQEPT